MMLLVVLAIIFGIVCLDQLTKWLAFFLLQGEPSFPIWRGVLHLTYQTNRGAAFGMLSDSRWIFMITSTVAIVGILFYLIKYRPKNKWLVASLAMIAGGGIGNMIDRIALGYVIDFIDFTLIDFAIFNVADSFVTVGAGIMIVYLICDMIRDYRETKKKTAQASADAEADKSAEEEQENE